MVSFFLVHPENWGRWTQFDEDFSNGSKPPTRWMSSNWRWLPISWGMASLQQLIYVGGFVEVFEPPWQLPEPRAGQQVPFFCGGSMEKLQASKWRLVDNYFWRCWDDKIEVWRYFGEYISLLIQLAWCISSSPFLKGGSKKQHQLFSPWKQRYAKRRGQTCFRF